MKSEIIARARGRNSGDLDLRSKDCGPRGMFGGVARRFSSRNIHARATLPMPIAFRARKRRRDQRLIASPSECGITFTQLGERINNPANKGNAKTKSKI